MVDDKPPGFAGGALSAAKHAALAAIAAVAATIVLQVLYDVQALAKALEVHDLPLPEEAQRIQYIGIVR